MRNFLTFICAMGVLVMIGCVFWGLLAPERLSKKVSKKQTFSRKQLTARFGAIAFILFVLAGIFAPPVSSVKANQQTAHTAKASVQSQASVNTQKTAQKAASNTATTKTVQLQTSIAYKTVSQDDNSVAKGQTVTAQQGVNGVQTSTYKVTYKNGQETGRTLISSAVTTPAVDEIVHNGTYVAPAPTTAPSTPSSASCTGGYVNVDGNCVPSPSSNPTGATAQCRDGTYSYSQNHSGTCSHHGGVSQWL